MIKVGNIWLGGRPRVAGVLVDTIDTRRIRQLINAGADLVEIRIDTFKRREPRYILKSLEILKSHRLPVILTIRSKKEGGKYRIDDAERLELFTSLTPLASAIDIELSSRGIIKEVIDTARRYRKRVIISYHDFTGTPEYRSLVGIIKRARRKGGDIIKIATKVRDREEIKRLVRILIEHRYMIVIAMGRKGTPSRVFFPLLGSLITYGATTTATAPGHIPLKTKKHHKPLRYRQVA